MSTGGGKHWAGRIVVAVQILCWCAVSVLLLNRGVTNLTNSSADQDLGRPARGFTAGVVMISMACLMLLVSPTLLIIKLLDMRRQRRILLQLAEDDLPPSYDEVMERAPTYSTLFLVPDQAELGLLEDAPYGNSRSPTIVTNLESAPRYSTLYLVTSETTATSNTEDSDTKKEKDTEKVISKEKGQQTPDNSSMAANSAIIS